MKVVHNKYLKYDLEIGIHVQRDEIALTVPCTHSKMCHKPWNKYCPRVGVRFKELQDEWCAWAVSLPMDAWRHVITDEVESSGKLPIVNPRMVT